MILPSWNTGSVADRDDSQLYGGRGKSKKTKPLDIGRHMAARERDCPISAYHRHRVRSYMVLNVQDTQQIGKSRVHNALSFQTGLRKEFDLTVHSPI